MSRHALLLAVLIAVLPAASCGAAPTGAGGPRVVVTTVEGPIVLRLFPREAPRTVANFTKLVREGYYDSLTFHRIVPDFVIQGGDPNSRNDNPFDDGQGGPGYTVPAEIGRKHLKGAVAMARLPDAANPSRASNGSQFYIALRDLPQLDGGYTVFGEVVSGWDTIARLTALAKRKDVARQNENVNAGRLALITSIRMAPAPPR